MFVLMAKPLWPVASFPLPQIDALGLGVRSARPSECVSDPALQRALRGQRIAANTLEDEARKRAFGRV
jgi:hypothetical protein